MERKYLKDLRDWNQDEERKPLLVLGGRQVGKSYLIEELFAKKYYRDAYLRIDCSDDRAFVDYVYKNDNLNAVLDYLYAKYDFIPDKNHLLIIDEAQECLPIIKMMKHFCERKRETPLIVLGSLVRIKINRTSKSRKEEDKSFLFPVGKINQLIVYPLTFDEFLFNYKRNSYDYLKQAFQEKRFINEELHQEMMNVFNDYLFVGGMPEAVNVFLKNRDNKVVAYEKVAKTLSDIYSNYLSDMEFYQASKESILKSRLIFKNIYSQLNKENKNFKCSLLDERFKTRDVLTPIEWLVTANVVHKAYLLKEHVSTPLVESEESLFRLYLSDMGLFTYQSGLNAKNFVLDKANTLSGIYYENYIATELVARNQGLFYWKGKRNSEFEFLIDNDGQVIPIDSKKKKGSLHSINEFRMHNKKGLVLKVSTNHYSYDEENEILTIPYYFFSFYLNALFEEK